MWTIDDGDTRKAPGCLRYTTGLQINTEILNELWVVLAHFGMPGILPERLSLQKHVYIFLQYRPRISSDFR